MLHHHSHTESTNRATVISIALPECGGAIDKYEMVKVLNHSILSHLQHGYGCIADLFVVGTFASHLFRLRIVYIGYHGSSDGNHTEGDIANVQHTRWIRTQ